MGPVALPRPHLVPRAGARSEAYDIMGFVNLEEMTRGMWNSEAGAIGCDRAASDNAARRAPLPYGTACRRW